jgi:hypothetical protein
MACEKRGPRADAVKIGTEAGHAVKRDADPSLLG